MNISKYLELLYEKKKKKRDKIKINISLQPRRFN